MGTTGLFADMFIGEVAIRWIAFLGGAVLGWFLVAPVALWVRGLFVKDGRDGPPTRLLIRILSATAVGVLLYCCVGFGTGGWGLGWGLGGGAGDKDKDKDGVKDGVKDGKPPGDKESSGGKEGGSGKGEESSVLRVEVLGPDVVRTLARGGKVDEERVYRVASGGKLLSLEEVQKLATARRKSKAGLKEFKVIRYTDSPRPELGQVADLMAWAKAEGLLPDNATPEQPNRKAPLE